MMTFFRRVFGSRLWLLAGLIVFVLPLAAQQAPASSVNVNVNANVVNVLATVRDKHGKLATDLEQSDFVLQEDGRPQTIRSFSRESGSPLTLGLLVDTSRSQRENLDQERSAGPGFLNQAVREDKDKAFLIHFDREVELLQDLTGSHDKLAAALNQLETPPQFGHEPGDSAGSGDEGSGRGSSRGGGTLLYDAIYLASTELMQKQQGRKVLILFSDGVDRESKTTLSHALETAQRADTVVYAILSPSRREYEEGGGRRGGMGGGGPWGRQGGGYPGGGYPGGGYPGGGGGRRSPSEEQHPDGKKILDRIAKETGGRMFEVSKKQTVEQIYQQIQDELKAQYRLGFTPDRAVTDSDYHKIQLTTKKKDFTVQAREGYYPMAPDTKAADAK
jgi:VWFA-related protein